MWSGKYFFVDGLIVGGEMKKQVNVAIGIICHHHQLLVGWRDEKLHQGGKYEFPGGKIEQGENAVNACNREVLEEVGIDIAVDKWRLLQVLHYEYDDLIVHLHCFQAWLSVDDISKINDKWHWISRKLLKNYKFPAANLPIIEQLYWPNYIKISENLQDISSLDNDSLLYWRTLSLDEMWLESQLQWLIDNFSEKIERCIVNIETYCALPNNLRSKIKQVHLKHSQLMQVNQLIELAVPEGTKIIASCHNLESLKYAEILAVDAVFCSPIQYTQTHPEQNPIGWETLQNWLGHLDGKVLCFALGGLSRDDLTKAQQSGAYGIAGIRYI